MRILIIGGAGMVGQKLASKIFAEGLGDGPVKELILYDVVEARVPTVSDPGTTKSRPDVRVLTGDIANPVEGERLAGLKADIIFHLAAIVSGDAEKNFEKGWDINARGSWNLLEGLKGENTRSDGTYIPRLVFSSSLAVFGPPYPEKIGDEFLSTPQTSYGAQKAVTELLVGDYSRKGFVDGICIRLPTVCVRPGKANLAASSFFSGIIREPLNGEEGILPVSTSVRHWHASPRSVVGFLLHAARLDTGLLNGRRSLTMPGVSCTVAEQIEALRTVAGEEAVRLIRHVPDDFIIRIIDGWPRDFDTKRARELGFSAEQSFEDIIRVYIEDDLSGN